MRVLFDTDVVLDLLIDREPFSSSAAELFSKVETGAISGFVCATTVTTIHYLAKKAVGATRSRAQIQKLLSFLEVAPVNRAVLEGALERKFRDFEDAVVCEAANQVEANVIVTRNVTDFKGANIPVYSPLEMVRILTAGKYPDE